MLSVQPHLRAHFFIVRFFFQFRSPCLCFDLLVEIHCSVILLLIRLVDLMIFFSLFRHCLPLQFGQAVRSLCFLLRYTDWDLLQIEHFLEKFLKMTWVYTNEYLLMKSFIIILFLSTCFCASIFKVFNLFFDSGSLNLRSKSSIIALSSLIYFYFK